MAYTSACWGKTHAWRAISKGVFAQAILDGMVFVKTLSPIQDIEFEEVSPFAIHSQEHKQLAAGILDVPIFNDGNALSSLMMRSEGKMDEIMTSV